MAPETVIADRVYRELKLLILRGDQPPAAPLVVLALAERFGTSIAPVRDALHRLVGERLVAMQGGGGFAMPPLTRQRAYNLYSWHGDILEAALKVMVKFERIEPPPAFLDDEIAESERIAAASADLFTQICACSPNDEHLDAVSIVGERLHTLRRCESVVNRQAQELRELWTIVCEGNRRATRTAISHYHKRRLARVDQIVSAALLASIAD
ncbi:GntR family transcriptional regulator [Sphingobium sp. 10 DY56-G10]|uniref:GntR family transcriptional regulator n=1 Tax=Sphingomonadales TaxID=204457 RepID=UPI0000D7B740|nr:GntR family transcriptional regulator [Sphingomonas sp. SKA58]EAT10635.1 hypothetical protein SKA58_02610 [Sphingomonas sp. SKA58]|tara:strand:- start:488 stop:1120 length:633 start_codon:yes stop_codon:yes gene_type:complete